MRPAGRQLYALGLIWLVTAGACWPRAKGTATPIPASSVTRRVDAMWVRWDGSGAPAVGGLTKVTLTTTAQRDGRVRVGVYEQFSGGTGTQWRTGIWIASFLAASSLGRDLTDFRFSASSDGYIDGASSSALIAAGFLASLTGTEVDAKATLAGALNPDGTIASVGGLPQKFASAIAAGKKRLGYPLGQRYDTDLNTGLQVDLERLARSHGARALPIRDLPEAYTFLTGKKLPAPRAARQREMRLAQPARVKLEKHLDEWRAIFAGDWQRLTRLRVAGGLPAQLIGLAEHAGREAERAEALAKRGHVASAYYRMLAATLYSGSAIAMWNVFRHARSGDIPAARAELGRLQGAGDSALRALQSTAQLQAGTGVAENLTTVSAFQSALAARGFYRFGADHLVAADAYLASLSGLAVANPPPKVNVAKLLDMIATPVFAFAHAELYSRVSAQTREVSAQPQGPMCTPGGTRRVAAAYTSAAAAGLRYFESMFLPLPGTPAGPSRESFRASMTKSEPYYLIALIAFEAPQASSGLMHQLREQWGPDSLAWQLALLGGSVLSYSKTSALFTKLYSLDIEVDSASGLPVRVENETVFRSLLENAERKAREHGEAARVAAGAIPAPAILRYQTARALRQGTLHEQISALEWYWESSLYSQLAVMMTRRCVDSGGGNK